jgi:hypothetical protein
MAVAEFTDAQRINWLAEQFKTCTVYMSGQHPWSPTSFKLRNLKGPTFRAALDAAMHESGWRADGVGVRQEGQR